MTEQRYKFATDDDGHNYLIPVDLYPLFIQLLENGEADCMLLSVISLMNTVSMEFTTILLLIQRRFDFEY